MEGTGEGVWAMARTQVKIRVTDVHKTYVDEETGAQVVAIGRADVEVRDGEFAVLLGPTGSGKSTLLHMLAGFVQPTSGSILLDDSPVRGPGPDRGIVFQEYVLFPWKTVLGNVRFGLDIARVPRAEANRVALEYIRQVGLAGFEHAYTHTLSGGMKQRVAIARALAYDPQVLLMDEPFGALDAQTRSVLIADLRRLHRQTGKTVVFVTHSVEEAIQLASRIYVFSARPSSVKAVFDVILPDPRNPEDAAFVALRAEVTGLLSHEVRTGGDPTPVTAR